jgi:hypothetical protein
MTGLAVVPARTPTTGALYAIEESLAALVDTAELVTPEQEAEFQEELRLTLTTAIEKRDRVGSFLAHCESQAALAGAEIKRLQERKKAYQGVVDRLETYIVRIIENLGADERGKYPKLEGRTVSFGLRGCPASVVPTNEEKIPAEYKTLTITIPALRWEALLDCADPELRGEVVKSIQKAEMTIDKKAIKAAMEAGVEVPGADLLMDKHSLVRK